MEIEKGAVVMTVSPQSWLKQYYVNRSVAAGRLTRFWGYVGHYHEDNDETQKKTQSIPLPIRITPFRKGVANRRLQQRLPLFYGLCRILSIFSARWAVFCIF